MSTSMNRRRFLALASLALPLSAKRLRAEHHVVSADPLMVEFDVSSLRELYTPEEDFYIRNHSETPADVSANFLRIEGEVPSPLVVTAHELGGLPRRKLGSVLECAGNPVATTALVSDGVWEGWSLRDVLSLARPSTDCPYINFFGRDGYARSVPAERAYRDGLIVTHLNGRPLGRAHGAPWRALFPGWYGMESVKWLQRIEFSRTELTSNRNAYLELARGSSGEIEARPLPRIQVKSLILTPRNGSTLLRGRVRLQGVAWSGEGKITRVDFSADGGLRWRPTVIKEQSPHDWCWWYADANLNQRGHATLLCRATDERGLTQPTARDARRLDGYVNNWCHRISCVVV
jgi:DMSO/TMAO reductase YedYZ molybdopterin-dependent catalytic subunit